jgi:hypothetical protein
LEEEDAESRRDTGFVGIHRNAGSGYDHTNACTSQTKHHEWPPTNTIDEDYRHGGACEKGDGEKAAHKEGKVIAHTHGLFENHNGVVHDDVYVCQLFEDPRREL